MKRNGRLAALLALWAGAATAVAAEPAPSAQGLQDPTRPPAAVMTAGAAQGGAQLPQLPQLPELQSVLVSQVPGARRIAVIDGESVRVGDSFRGARVLRIADNEVELQRGRERQVLRLYAPDGTSGMTRVVPARSRHKGEP